MKRPLSDHESSSEPLTKGRGIKCDGGYCPPPMFTAEQLRAYARRQNMKVAAAGFKFLNETMATEGKPEFELVAANASANFRTKIGHVYQGNFVAKRSGKTNATQKLFFVECKLARDGDGALYYEVIKCIDLGPVNMAAAQCRRSCKFCRNYDRISPIFHPPGFKIRHLCFRPS